jgi:hypothetical protein
LLKTEVNDLDTDPSIVLDCEADDDWVDVFVASFSYDNDGTGEMLCEPVVCSTVLERSELLVLALVDGDGEGDNEIVNVGVGCVLEYEILGPSLDEDTDALLELSNVGDAVTENTDRECSCEFVLELLRDGDVLVEGLRRDDENDASLVKDKALGDWERVLVTLRD